MPSPSGQSNVASDAEESATVVLFADDKESYVEDFREDRRRRQLQHDEKTLEDAHGLLVVVSVVCVVMAVANLLAGLGEDTQAQYMNAGALFAVAIVFFGLYVWGTLHFAASVSIALLLVMVLWMIDAGTGGGRTLLTPFFDVAIRIVLLMKLHAGALAGRRLRGESA